MTLAQYKCSYSNIIHVFNISNVKCERVFEQCDQNQYLLADELSNIGYVVSSLYASCSLLQALVFPLLRQHIYYVEPLCCPTSNGTHSLCSFDA